MHKRLERQLRQSIEDAATQQIDLPKLLSVIDSYYDKLDSTEVEAASAPAALRAAFDNVSDAVLTLDATGRITFANRAAEQVFDVQTANLVGLPCTRLLPGLAGRDIDAALAPCLTRFEDTQFEIKRIELEASRIDGEHFFAEVNASRLSADPRNEYVVCLRDVTERRAARLALHENEERYRALVENAPEAILVFDVDDDKFIDVNENATRLFNMSRKRLMNIGPAGISPENQLDGSSSFGRVRGHVSRALDGEQPVFEWLHLNADGHEFPCEVRFSQLPSINRRLIRASVTDISDRKRSDLLTYGENRILEMIAAGTDAKATLKAVCRTVEQVVSASRAAIFVKRKDELRLGSGPSLSAELRKVLERGLGGEYQMPAHEVVRNARQFVGVTASPEAELSGFCRAIDALGVRAIWSFPLIASEDDVFGTLDVYLDRGESPETHDLDAIANLVRLCGIAIKRDQDEKALRWSERRFRGLFENVLDGVYISNPAGRLVAANPALVRMLGFNSESQIQARSSKTFYVNPDDQTRFLEALHKDFVVKNFEVRLRRLDGSQIVVLENARAVRDAAGVIVAHEGTMTDITERKRTETLVFEEKERAQVTLNSIGDGVITTDANGCVDYLNPVAADLIGWEPRAAKGRGVDQVLTAVDSRSRELLDNPVLRCLGEGRVITLPEASALVDRDGKSIEIQDSTAPIRDRMGNVIGAVMVFHELNKASRLSRQLSYQAAHDSLTGLINRREFENQVSGALAEIADDSRKSNALLVIDIDQFKVINDSLGHTGGDEYLRQLADQIQGEIRITDNLGRIGGDQFGVLLRNCSEERAVQVAESVRRAICQFTFSWQDRTISARASVGMVVIDTSFTDTGNVLSAADVACFAAKDAGRDRIHVFQSGDTTAIQQEMAWADRLTDAVENGRMTLFYQPISAIGELAGRTTTPHYELLLRMRDEVGELVAPGHFIPAAERFNLMPMIDRWVFDTVIDQYVDRIGSDGEANYSLAINLSGNSLSDERFLNYIAERVKAAELPERALCIEITETSAIASIQEVADFMHRLRDLGCIFSLDDFGSGLSSFTYIKTLPIDFIKIDGAFISNVTHDLMDQSLVSAISQIGRSLGVYTVAERVESPDVLETLVSIGIEYAQGYLIAEPRPVEELDLNREHVPAIA